MVLHDKFLDHSEKLIKHLLENVIKLVKQLLELILYRSGNHVVFVMIHYKDKMANLFFRYGKEIFSLCSGR